MGLHSNAYVQFLLSSPTQERRVKMTAVLFAGPFFFLNQPSIILYIWTASSEFGTYSLCEQRRFRRDCASAQSRQNLRCRAVSPEPSLLAHTSSESRGTFRQKARSLAPLNGWACTVKICHDGMLEDTNSLDGAHFMNSLS